MKRRIVIVVALSAMASIFAISASGQTAVPVEKEPMHRLRFENEFIRMYDVLIPMGKASVFHTHVFDGVSVRLSDTVVMDEFADGNRTSTEISYGTIGFSARPSAMTHRVIVTGKADFRNLFIELIFRSTGKAVEHPKLTPGHDVLLENDRVRISRLVLKPGDASILHTHPMHGLGIMIRGSTVELTSPAQAARTLSVKAGDHSWQEAGTRHMIRNVGATVFEAIDIEIK